MTNTSRYDSIKCIWMASNLVEYKLCDRSFDCDNCIFDRVMRNKTAKLDVSTTDSMPDLLLTVINNLNELEYNDRYIYLTNNLMLKPIFPNTYYFGFNSSVLPLFDSTTRIEHCAEHDIVSRGEKIIKVQGCWGEITISSPIDYKCLDKLSNQKTHALERWFSLIQTEKPEVESSTISQDIFNSNIFHLIHELNNFKPDYPELGATMLDGGQKADSLCQVIGNTKYKRLLDMLFNG